jgi:hypothetical protein
MPNTYQDLAEIIDVFVSLACLADNGPILTDFEPNPTAF